jgi:hypothetical protein
MISEQNEIDLRKALDLVKLGFQAEELDLFRQAGRAFADAIAVLTQEEANELMGNNASAITENAKELSTAPTSEMLVRVRGCMEVGLKEQYKRIVEQKEKECMPCDEVLGFSDRFMELYSLGLPREDEGMHRETWEKYNI